MACATACAELRDDVEDDILRTNTLFELTLDVDTHTFGLRLQNTLRSKSHLYLACADTKGNTTQCSVCRGVAVATYDGHTRLCKARLRTDDVDDTIVLLADGEDSDVILLAVHHQRCHLLGRLGLCDWQVLIGGGDVVVGACRNLLGTEHLDTTTAQARKSLRTCYLVNILTVDIENTRAAVNCAYGVCIPNLIEKCIHSFMLFLKLHR